MACKGWLFRADVSQYFSRSKHKRTYGKMTIGHAVRLRHLKRTSCHGCPQCGWMDEYLEDTVGDLPVDGIEECEHGKIYELKGAFSGTGEDVEFEGFYLAPYKEKKYEAM